MRYMKGEYKGNDNGIPKGRVYHLNLSVAKDISLDESGEYICKEVGLKVRYMDADGYGTTGEIVYSSEVDFARDWRKHHRR